MTAIGDVDLWSDTFPDHLIPRILDLVVDAWETMAIPDLTEHEVPITRRFRRVLKQAKDYKRLPLRIDRETTEDDDAGEELGRIDLKFLPAMSALEEVYFAFECKRLNVPQYDRRWTGAPEYVREGMMRFVTNKYASQMQDGGMIGYVLDGRCDDAIRLVQANMQINKTHLKLADTETFARSRLRPENHLIRETEHKIPRAFRIHHVFLSCQ